MHILLPHYFGKVKNVAAATVPGPKARRDVSLRPARQTENNGAVLKIQPYKLIPKYTSNAM